MREWGVTMKGSGDQLKKKVNEEGWTLQRKKILGLLRIIMLKEKKYLISFKKRFNLRMGID